MSCLADPAQKIHHWALHSADAAAAAEAAAAAACPAAVLAVGVDAAAFAATVDSADAAVDAAGAGFCVQPSCLVLSSCAARKPELLLLACRQASHIWKGRKGEETKRKEREEKEWKKGLD